MSLDDQDVLGEAGDLRQCLDGIITMIENPQVQDNIELTNCLRRESRHIDLARAHVYAKRRARNVECFAPAKIRM